MTDDTETLGQRVAYQIVRKVAELPDRTSPDGQPEMMLVTEAELAEIAMEVIAAANARLERERDGWKSVADHWALKAPTITAERDAATSALAKAEGDNRKLRDALIEIECGHIPDQPASSAVEELTWAQMWVGKLRRIARAALTPAPEAPKDGE